MSAALENIFREAFERLKKRKPKHPDLIALVAQGKALVNITNVALEAGKSRTHIGHKDCAFPELRFEILAYSQSEPNLEYTPKLVTALRAELSELKRLIELKDTFIAELMIENARLSGRKADPHADHDGDNVVSMRQERVEQRRKARQPT